MSEPTVAPRLLSALSSAKRLETFAALLAGVTDEEGAPRGSRERLRSAGIDPLAPVSEIAATFAAAFEEVRRETSGRHHLVRQCRAPESLPFRHGRLVEIPSNKAQLTMLLDWIAADYLRADTYAERALNHALQTITDDYALLRRHLFDFGYFTRDPHTGTYSRLPTS